MIELGHPEWLLALLLIPLLSHLPAWGDLHDILWYPSADELVRQWPKHEGEGEESIWIRGLVWLGLALMVVGLADPTYSLSERHQSQSGRDIMLVLDTSQSMDIADIAVVGSEETMVSRIDAVKAGVAELLDASEGNRVGLIAFGEQSFVMSDLTPRNDTVGYLASQLETGFAGDSTRLGDALGYAASLFSAKDSDRALIVLITDGNDTGSDLPPLEAARLAKGLGVKLYLAAVGAPASADREPIDESLLSSLVDRTGGEFFRVMQLSDFDAMWQTLERLEPQQERFEQRMKTFHLAWVAWAASFGLLLLAGWWATQSLPWGRG